MRADRVDPRDGRRRTLMATASRQRATREVEYPTGDGKPMAETDAHRDDMVDVIQMLRDHFADRPDVYVSGNLLMFYVEGDRRKHISPDVFVVRGVEKKDRDHHLIWKEGKAPDVVIEITSKTTRREDQSKKKELYRAELKVPEYFQFDPTEDYLKPPLQGFRLIDDVYAPIEPVNGRLPSDVLGLHFERNGKRLRLFNPATGARLLTTAERSELAERLAEAAERRCAEAERQRADAAEDARRRLAEENDRLRKLIEAQRRG
jgi:Uma2 family endonuclease